MRCPFPLASLALLAALLTGCGGKDPDARKTPDEDRLTAKAVADVDAALAEINPPAQAAK